MDDSLMNTIDRFLLHGADIETFGLEQEEDKKTFFYMFKTFLEAINKLEKEIKIQILPESDILVFVDDLPICEFYISPDYTTLNCNTHLLHNDEKLLYIVGIMMLTIKEFNQTVTDTSLFGSKIKKNNLNSNKKFKGLPPSVSKIVNKISKMQKTILNGNKKYQFKPKKDI
jgi:hypothetical protein